MGADLGTLVGEVLIVAALVLGTGAGDKSAPSSSVSAIVPHLALLPPPARSSSILVLLCPTSTPMLQLEMLLCTLVLPLVRSGLISTLATQLVTPLSILTITLHHPVHQHPHPSTDWGMSGTCPLFLVTPSFLL